MGSTTVLPTYRAAGVGDAGLVALWKYSGAWRAVCDGALARDEPDGVTAVADAATALIDAMVACRPSSSRRDGAVFRAVAL